MKKLLHKVGSISLGYLQKIKFQFNITDMEASYRKCPVARGYTNCTIRSKHYIQVNVVIAGIPEKSWRKAVSHVIQSKDNYLCTDSTTEENITQTLTDLNSNNSNSENMGSACNTCDLDANKLCDLFSVFL
jgi:hypothetical protein